MTTFTEASFGGQIIRSGRHYIAGGTTMADRNATLLYYNAEGQQVAEDDPSATKQYRSDDPVRPDAKQAAPSEDKAQEAPAENKARQSAANK